MTCRTFLANQSARCSLPNILHVWCDFIIIILQYILTTYFGIDYINCITLYPVLQRPASCKFGPQVKKFGHPWIKSYCTAYTFCKLIATLKIAIVEVEINR